MHPSIPWFLVIVLVGIGTVRRRRKAGPTDRAPLSGSIILLCVAIAAFTSCGTERSEPDHASPADAARGERLSPESPRGLEDRVPAELLVAEGACPFECCTYREWRAPVPLPRLSAPIDGAPIDTIPVGEMFDAVTGIVFITGIQVIVVLDSLDGSGEPRPSVAASAVPWTAVFLPGDTLVALDYLGEGFFRAWDGAETREVQQFWWPVEAEEAAPGWASHGRAIGTYGSEWWIRSRRTDDVEGWFQAPDQYMPGSDACGVD